MPIVIVFAVSCIVVFTALTFTIMVMASRCLYELQGTPAETRLRAAIVETRPSRFLPGFVRDGGPLDSRSWLALREADYLPEVVQRKARIVCWLYVAARLIFILFGLTILATAIVQHRA